jgi:hypothetical protein
MTAPLDNGAWNDQGIFYDATNKIVAPIAYGIGASLGWHRNGTNLPSGPLQARLRGVVQRTNTTS